LCLYDPATGKLLTEVDAAPERNRKPTLTALAADDRFVAVGREDGTVVLFDSKLERVRSFDKHHVAQPDTGATTLADVSLVFGALWVSAGPKGKPVGLTAYRLTPQADAAGTRDHVDGHGALD
jgi:hypothetical protein